MLLRIEIKTVKGCARDTASKIKPFILGKQKVINKVWANKADDRIYWTVDCYDSRIYQRIAANLAIFDKAIRMVLGNRLLLAAAGVKDEQKKELRAMFDNQTSIRQIRGEGEYDLQDFTQEE